jgi:hypothetical protein
MFTNHTPKTSNAENKYHVIKWKKLNREKDFINNTEKIKILMIFIVRKEEIKKVRDRTLFLSFIGVVRFNNNSK